MVWVTRLGFRLERSASEKHKNMGRKQCCLKERVNRGAWSLQEDEILTNYIQLHGEGKWRTLPQNAGLKRCGKSCRLRWMNYLRPGIKRGNISPEEEDLIIRLHRLLGNRWSLIAGRLPGRTDNEIKNYWNSVLSKKLNGAASPRPSNKHRHKLCEQGSKDCKFAIAMGTTTSSSSNYNVIAPKATRCTKKILVSLDKGKGNGRVLNNVQSCLPPSTPTDDAYDQFMLESRKGEVDDNAVNTPSALDNYLDFSKTPIQNIYENGNMLEIDLAHMFQTEFENLTSLLELEDEWRDL